MKKTKKIVIIIPTFNESENIEKTINVVSHALPKKNNIDFGILIVDGNSPDGTAKIVRSLIKDSNILHLLVEKEKSGLGSAYLKGMEYAFNILNADYIFEFDADLSHDASKIKNFVEKIEEGYDLVLGTRYRHGGSIPSNWGIHRKFLSIFGNLFIRVLFLNSNISDWTGGYKAVSKKVYFVAKDTVSTEKGYTFQISLNKTAIDNKFRIAEVPFAFKDRKLGKSKLGPEYLINAFLFVIKTRINDFFTSNFVRVALVGTVGATVQFITYRIYRSYIPYDIITHNLSIESAILSNFLLNNFSTFRAQKINGVVSFFRTFVKFNMVSFGSILVQNIVMRTGLYILGNTDPHIKDYLNISGILIGLFFNYYFYTRFIWKQKKQK